MLLVVKHQCEINCSKKHPWTQIFFPREEVQEFFDKMDRDFDGRLSFGEFMGEETPLEKVFKNMDKDGDGTITKEVKLVLVDNSFTISI